MASLDHFLISSKLLPDGNPEVKVPFCVFTSAQRIRDSIIISLRLIAPSHPLHQTHLHLPYSIYKKKKRPRYHNVVASKPLKSKINIWLNKLSNHKTRARLLSQRISRTIGTNQILCQRIFH
jgi:hypothetical protein